jgi:Raf kinase inhibitor-like YbhB/YbcL family protein
MYRVARLVIPLCLAVLLVGGCAASQAPAPTTAPPQPELRPATPTEAPTTPPEMAPTAAATDTALPATPAPSATALPPTAVPRDTAVPATAPVLALKVSSVAFDAGAEIPVRHSCFGANLSPPLTWSGLPGETASLVLVVDDADSQPPGFVHWVVYNLPATTSGLPEGLSAQGELDDGTLQGTNDFAPFVGQTFPSGAAINRVGYDGPCPPGRHRYVFTVYALDTQLDLPAEATADQVLTAMQGHVLTQALLAGVFTPPQ